MIRISDLSGPMIGIILNWEYKLTFIELGEIWKRNLGLYSKDLIFHVFFELEEIEKSS